MNRRCNGPTYGLAGMHGYRRILRSVLTYRVVPLGRIVSGSKGLLRRFREALEFLRENLEGFSQTEKNYHLRDFATCDESAGERICS